MQDRRTDARLLPDYLSTFNAYKDVYNLIRKCPVDAAKSYAEVRT